MVNHFVENDKPIALICHGLQILSAAQALKGKKITAYPTRGPEIIVAGADFQDVEPTEMVVDGNLVTAPAWPGHPTWLAVFLEVFSREISPKQN